VYSLSREHRRPPWPRDVTAQRVAQRERLRFSSDVGGLDGGANRSTALSEICGSAPREAHRRTPHLRQEARGAECLVSRSPASAWPHPGPSRPRVLARSHAWRRPFRAAERTCVALGQTPILISCGPWNSTGCAQGDSAAPRDRRWLLPRCPTLLGSESDPDG